MYRADILRLPWRVSIADATGSARPCRLIVNRGGLRHYPCTPSGEFSRRLVRRLWKATVVPWTISSGLFIVAFFAIIWPFENDLVYAPGDIMLLIATLWLMSAVIYLTLGFVPTVIAYRHAYVGFCTESRRCAWCHYDLSGVPADSLDLTTCPECGGRWRLPTPSPEA